MSVWKKMDIGIYEKQLRKIQTELQTMSREDHHLLEQWGKLGERLGRLEKAVDLLISRLLVEKEVA